jgi:hypothetical protein
MEPPQMNPLMPGDPSALLEKLIIDGISILTIRTGDIERACNREAAPVSLAFRSNVKYHVRLRNLSATAIFIAGDKLNLNRRGVVQKLKLLKLLQLKLFPGNWNWLSAVQSLLFLLSVQSLVLFVKLFQGRQLDNLIRDGVLQGFDLVA